MVRREDRRVAAREAVRRFLAGTPLPSREWGPNDWAIGVPGAGDYPIDVGLHLGDYTLTVAAFLMRRPPEAEAMVHDWLLRRQAGRSLVRYCMDEDGDLAIRADLLLEGLDETVLDRVVAAAALEHQRAFVRLVEIGWARFFSEREAGRGSGSGHDDVDLDAGRRW